MPDSPRLEELRRRVQTDPTSIVFAALAEEYRRAGLFWEAIETCRNGLKRHPNYLSARVTLGRALVEVGELDEARQELESVLRLAPENLAAIRTLAEIHERSGKPELTPVTSSAAPLGPGEPPAEPAEAAHSPASDPLMPRETERAQPASGPVPPSPQTEVGRASTEVLARLQSFLHAIAAERQRRARQLP